MRVAQAPYLSKWEPLKWLGVFYNLCNWKAKHLQGSMQLLLLEGVLHNF